MKLLFICTHNRCRSILCEAISNHAGEARLEARSAGSAPAEQVHPLTLKYLAEAGIPTAGLHSKSWNDLEAYQPDLLITVCDSAAGEACPLYLGSIPRVHWGLGDPSAVAGSEADIAGAFRETISAIRARTETLLALPLENMTGQGVADSIAALL